jgi:hypothetical protein
MAIRHGHQELVNALDIMPCDYRYYRGQENPLDKLVEAAMMLEELGAQIQGRLTITRSLQFIAKFISRG